MKKKTALFIAALIMTVVAQAAINIDWKASAGFYFSADDSVGILGDATGNSTYAYLVYDVDTTVGNIFANSYSIGSSIGDGGTILDSITLTEDMVSGNFDDYAYFSAQNFTDTYTAGYVYAIIFEDDNISNNDWYFNTDPVAITDVSGAIPTQIIEMNSNTVSGDAIDGVPPEGFATGQVVPEPATFLMFVLGGIGAWVLRRKNRSFFNK
jgi:hypothetical protein